MRFSILCLGCLGLVACDTKDTGSSGTTAFTDADEDGFGPDADCDDNNAAIHPNADELCDGIDNNCDGVIDTDALDALTGYLDTDGDGFGDPDTMVRSCDISGFVEDGTDCDDTSAARAPDADEICDGIDNDCDGLVDGYDDDTIGTTTFWLDSDGDGYGGETTVDSCEAPLGYVENNDDCDDTNPGASPAWYEVVCDGIDNDCDGVVDANLVPRDFASIQEAADGLPDGSEICLDAGTHAENIDLMERILTVTGRGNMEDVVLELGGSAPFFFVHSADESRPARLTLQNVSVTGDYADEGVLDGTGAFVYADRSAVSLRNVAVEGATVSGPDSLVIGGLVYGYAADISANNLSITDLSVSVDETASGSTDIVGGAFAMEMGTLALTDVHMAGGGAFATNEARPAAVIGLLAYGYDSDLDLQGVSLTGASSDLAGGETWGLGMALANEQGDLSATGLEVTDNTFAFNASGNAMGWGVVGSITSGGGSLSLTDLDLSGNDVTTAAGGGSIISGALTLIGPELMVDGATVYNNSATASSEDEWSGSAFGTVLAVGGGSLSHIDARGNALSAAGGEATGGGVLLSAAGGNTLSLHNAIVAANTTESASGPSFGAGVALSATADATVELANASIHGNHVLGGADVGGSGVYAYYGDGYATVTNTSISGGTVAGEMVYGTTVSVDMYDEGSYGPPVWTYNNVWDSGTEDIFYGIDDPTGDDSGNIAVDPKYNNITDADPANWDFTYPATSGLRNAGDPDVLDGGGSRSDIGAYGGPGSEGW